MEFDLVIIGGGIVGMATALQFTRKTPGTRALILEKEGSLAAHQTGRNSGVIHSGIYYKPGSLKALNCRAGREALIKFCTEEGIPFDLCGKVIVATSESELPQLQRLHDRGIANGVRCERIDSTRLRELEPHCAGIAALQVHDAGIVNYRKVTERMAERIGKAGSEIRTGARVFEIRNETGAVTVETTAGRFRGRRVVNCGGLHSDRIAALGGMTPTARIVPFRGEYFHVSPQRKHLCRNLIYPVPDPAFPFLGVHFTRTIEGGLECGPNAVLAFGREGYRFWQVSPGDLISTMFFPGFQKMAAKHWRMGLHEMHRSLWKPEFVRALQRLIPEIQGEDLHPAPAGIRAQAVQSDGALVDDFVFDVCGRIVNVINAPSPAATASLAVGSRIVEKLETIQA